MKLPAAWSRLRLSDLVLDLRNGTTAPQNKERVGIPVTRIESLQAGKFDAQRFGFLDAPAEELVNFLYETGDIAFSHINSLVHVGKTAIYEGTPPVLVHGMNLLRLRPDSRLITPRFLNWALNESGFRNRVRNSVNKAVNQVSINQQRLGVLEIALAPLNEQRRIVEKLDAIFQQTHVAKARLERLPAMLAKLKRSILAAAFRGDLTVDWRATHPDVNSAHVLQHVHTERRQRWLDALQAKGKDLAKAKYDEPRAIDADSLPELPAGWSWTSLGSLSWDSSYGTSNKCDYEGSGVYVLRIPNVASADVNLSDLKRSIAEVDLDRHELIEKGDFLIVRTNGSRDLIGRAACVPDGSAAIGYYFASYLIRFRLVDAEIGRWLSLWWRSPFMRQWLESRAASSAGQYNISLSTLAAAPVPIPSIDELRRVVELVEEALSVASSLSARLESAKKAAARLERAALAKAFRGELVEQDPADEPVTELVARIRSIASAASGDHRRKSERKARAAPSRRRA